jgi:uroporphyrinogen decarboxylase
VNRVFYHIVLLFYIVSLLFRKAKVGMSNREWIFDVLSHKSGTKVPFNFMFSPVINLAVKEYYGCDGDIKEVLDFPIRDNGTVSIKPLFANPDIYGDTIKDEFGVVWSTNKIDRGVPIIHCLNEPTLTDYHFPNPSDAYRFEGLGEWCKKNAGNFTILWVGDLWERAVFMRGMQELLLDTYINPVFVHDLLRKIADYILETMKILFERFEFDAVAVSDDYGLQKSMMMSPDCWREFVRPYLSEVYSYGRAMGRKIFHHSCGHIYPIISDLIEIGLDILHPIQPEAMDIYQLKREFGKDLTFCGGINTQRLLPHGTADEIREEVRRLKDEMGAGGGYILEPGITVLADVPLKNIIAAIEEARK